MKAVISILSELVMKPAVGVVIAGVFLLLTLVVPCSVSARDSTPTSGEETP
jgi:hypothetical protein